LTAARTAMLFIFCAQAGCLDAPPSSSGEPDAPHSLQFFGSAYRDNGVDRAWIAADRSPVGRIGQRDFTVELWLKVDAADLEPIGFCPAAWYEGTILLDRGFYNAAQKGDIGLGVYRSGTGSGIVATFDVLTERVNLCGDAPVADGFWHHVAFTRNESDALAIWVDGVLDEMADGPGGDGSYADTLLEPLLEGDRFMVLGGPKYTEDTSPGFAGRIDDVRLSGDDIYQQGFVPPLPPLEVDPDKTLALWGFDEGVGDASEQKAGDGSDDAELRIGGDPAGPVWSDDVPRP
jgi:hypothetical protein